MSLKDIYNSLEDSYFSKNNDIILLYGSRYSGLESVVDKFLNNKKSFVYKARELDAGIQMDFIRRELLESSKLKGVFKDDFNSVINYYANNGDYKRVVVLNSFEHILSANKTFLNFLLSLTRDSIEQGKIMIILISDDCYYVENELPNILGSKLYEINKTIKLELINAFDLYKEKKEIGFINFLSLYSVIGYDLSYWNKLSSDISLKDFFCEYLYQDILDLCHYNTILPPELRETVVYNTILYVIGDGFVKLNEIYERTGYERAKISVYLKNLIKRGIVKKCDSIGINCTNEKKGTYYISNEFLKFWYKFIFPNLSLLYKYNAERFYKKFIEPGLNAYREYTYICMVKDFLNEEFKDKQKDFVFKLFYDKFDAIQVIGNDLGGKIILCSARLSQPHMSYSVLEKILESAQNGKIIYDNILLVSAVGFDQKLHLYSSVHNNIKLIDYIG